MSPTLATLAAATPKCPGAPVNLGAALCGKPLVWNQATARWACVRHGPVLTAEMAAERVR